MIKNKKVLITGGAGFIANTIIKRFVETHKIIVYDNFERDTLSSSGLGAHKNLTIIKGDIRAHTNSDEILKNIDVPVLIFRANPETGGVIHERNINRLNKVI